MPPTHADSAAGGRFARVVLAISIALFVALSWRIASTMGTWHEEVSVYPSAGALIVDDDGRGMPRLLSRCTPGSGARTALTRERPVLSLCESGRALPIMVSSYFAGYLYWPAEALRAWHRDDALRLRWFGIWMGVVELASAWTLLRRLGGDAIAAAGALAIATSTPYVYVHALLVHYEFTPWMFLGGALLAWVDAAGTWTSSTRRFLLGALLLGLALAGNVKTAFLLLPLALYARLRGAHVPAGLRRWIPAAVVLVLLPLAPLAYLTAIDPSDDFSHQLARRAGVAAHKLLSPAWFGEPLNMVRYWSDVGSYFDQIQGAPLAAYWTWVLPGAALVHCGWHAIRALRRRPHSAVSAVCGLLLLAYVAVCTLFYSQHPEANYAPLHTIFGAATGAFCVAAGDWLAQRRWRAHAGALSLGLAAVVSAGFCHNVLRRGDLRDSLALPFNLSAQQAMVASLVAEPGGEVLTTTYNLAGVADSLSNGSIRAVQVHPYLGSCDGRGGEEREPCLVRRFLRIFALPGMHRPISVLLPAGGTMVDEAYAPDLLPAIEQAAAQAGLRVERQQDFTTGRGVVVLRRVVVGGAG